jgi:hypothetical protein
MCTISNPNKYSQLMVAKVIQIITLSLICLSVAVYLSTMFNNESFNSSEKGSLPNQIFKYAKL